MTKHREIIQKFLIITGLTINRYIAPMTNLKTLNSKFRAEIIPFLSTHVGTDPIASASAAINSQRRIALVGK